MHFYYEYDKIYCYNSNISSIKDYFFDHRYYINDKYCYNGNNTIPIQGFFPWYGRMKYSIGAFD